MGISGVDIIGLLEGGLSTHIVEVFNQQLDQLMMDEERFPNWSVEASGHAKLVATSQFSGTSNQGILTYVTCM